MGDSELVPSPPRRGFCSLVSVKTTPAQLLLTAGRRLLILLQSAVALPAGATRSASRCDTSLCLGRRFLSLPVFTSPICRGSQPPRRLPLTDFFSCPAVWLGDCGWPEDEGGARAVDYNRGSVHLRAGSWRKARKPCVFVLQPHLRICLAGRQRLRF